MGCEGGEAAGSRFKVQGKGQGPRFNVEQFRELQSMTSIHRCESVCSNRRNEERVRLPRPVRHERGEGRGEGCPTMDYSLAVAERLLSPALSSVPNGGEGDGGHGVDGTNFRKD